MLPSGVETFNDHTITEGAPSKTGGSAPMRTEATVRGPVGKPHSGTAGTDNPRANQTTKMAPILSTPGGKARGKLTGGRDTGGTVTTYNDGSV